VVGVDGSASSRAALDWAVDEARVRAGRLTVVRAHLPEFFRGLSRDPGLAWDAEADAEAARATLDAAVDSVDTSGVAVERLVVADGAAPAILVVVGSRGKGGFTGMLLGSVSAHVAHHATCPVVVLRSPEVSSVA
jgi:nucleotide-binding universal stress UspA family protein